MLVSNKPQKSNARSSKPGIRDSIFDAGADEESGALCPPIEDPPAWGFKEGDEYFDEELDLPRTRRAKSKSNNNVDDDGTLFPYYLRPMYRMCTLFNSRTFRFVCCMSTMVFFFIVVIFMVARRKTRVVVIGGPADFGTTFTPTPVPMIQPPAPIRMIPPKLSNLPPRRAVTPPKTLPAVLKPPHIK